MTQQLPYPLRIMLHMGQHILQLNQQIIIPITMRHAHGLIVAHRVGDLVELHRRIERKRMQLGKRWLGLRCPGLRAFLRFLRRRLGRRGGRGAGRR